MKDPRTLHSALYNYNRHLANSRYLNVLSNEQVDEMDASQLYQLIGSLLQYAHTISYTGTIPIDQVKEILKPYYQTDQKLTDCPAHVRLPVRESQGNEIFFLHKPMAQAQVRIELAGETYNELHRPAIDYYNEYFAGGMAGIVFQELRESRALAYVAAARYLTANYADDENLMVGIIGCQPDKTVEAVAAFIEILDNMPRQEQRFANTRQSLINQYRTSKLTTRQLLPTVLSWEQLGLSIDPRQSRYQQVLAADIDLLTTFHDTQIKDHPKLISIVGDETKIDMDKLAAYGKITKLTADQLFGF